jgi:hypothetical protein
MTAGVGELEDFGEFQPGLEGGYWDGGDVVFYATYLAHHYSVSVAIIHRSSCSLSL